MSSIINNSYKSIGEGTTNETEPKKKICSRKIIIISVSISIVVISLIILLVYFYVIKPNQEEEEEKEIICDQGYFIPDDDESKTCFKCSLENCRTCSGSKNNNKCTQCVSGYILQNSICEIEHSMKAIYCTKENDETISLMHYIYTNHIKK